jgi:hypothetical protein
MKQCLPKDVTDNGIVSIDTNERPSKHEYQRIDI